MYLSNIEKKRNSGHLFCLTLKNSFCAKKYVFLLIFRGLLQQKEYCQRKYSYRFFCPNFVLLGLEGKYKLLLTCTL